MLVSMSDTLDRVTTHARPTVSVRRAFRAAVLLSAPALALVAVPAHADVAVGWSNPAPVDSLHALLVFVGAPVLLFVLIALGVYLPSMVRGERLLPDHSGGQSQWLGGPKSGTLELPAAGASDENETGGASGSW